MGSLQTEIQKTLNSWNTVQQPPVADSIARKVFDFVQNNPSCTSNAVVQATGIDLGRASATLLTLYQKGKLDRKPYPNPNPEGKRDTIYHYWTAVNNFTDKGEKRVAKKPKKDKALSKANVSIEDVNTARFDLPRIRHIPVEQAPTKKEFDPQSFVADLNVRDAKEVYLLLKGYFE